MKQKRKHIFSAKTIKGKILWYNFFILCILAVIFSVSSYIAANRKSVQVVKNSLDYHVESISYHYRMAYEEMLHILLNCTEQSNFDLSLVGTMETSAQRRQGLDYARLANNFCSVTSYGNYISRLCIFNEDGVIVQSGAMAGSTDDAERIQSAPWFADELEKTIDSYPLDLEEPVFFNQKGKMVPILHQAVSRSPKAWAGLFLSTELFQNELKENDSGNEILVTTAKGERLASLHEAPAHREENDRLIRELLAQKEKSGIFSRELHGRDSMAAYEKSDRSGILVLEISDLQALRNDRMMIVQTLVVIFVAAVILGLVLSAIFGSHLRRPIDRLVKHIGRISEGDFSQNPEIESEDEIGTIGKVVNDMSGQIENLMQQRLDIEKEKSGLELRMLQAQINPHFLYNTLDSVKWMAVIQKNSGIVKVVTSLSGLLKNMAKGFNEKVSLREELDFLQDYVTIEKLRYAELFDVEICVDEPELYHARIIKLTLQPLVENSIFSGIEPSGKNGKIRIHAYAKDGNLYLTVWDNGVGIEPEKIGHLLEDTERLHGDRMSSIGMANVDRRIRLTYGEAYGLSVASEVGVYTEITVKIPLETEEGEGNKHVQSNAGR